MKSKDYSNIDWNQYFEYSETSPSGLVWKVNRGTVKCFGKRAGSLNNTGHWAVRINGEAFLVHRIVWILHYGSIEQRLDIDHIDGNPSNNNIDNLRLVNNLLNSKNRKMRYDNNTGATGVRFRIRREVPYYQAYYWNHDENKQKYKCFNINRYGQEKAFVLACQWREDRIAEMGGYTERHGK